MQPQQTLDMIGGEGEGEFPPLLPTPHQEQLKGHLKIVPLCEWVELHLEGGGRREGGGGRREEGGGRREGEEGGGRREEGGGRGGRW